MSWGCALIDVVEQPAGDGEDYVPLVLETDRGDVECRYFPAQGSTRAVAFVGGAGGGWDSPARNLYPRLARRLRAEGIPTLRLRFRDPRSLENAVFDLLAGMTFLREEGVSRFGLVGHSFGGAVVIQAAALSQSAFAVVTLATQSFGAHPVQSLAPGAATLLIHGTHDEVLPASCSRSVYFLAHEPRRLLLLDRARHGLDEAAADVEAATHDWLVAHL